MIIASNTVIVIGHDIGIGVTDITTSDYCSGLVSLIGQQQEGEDDTTSKDPLSVIEWHLDCICWAIGNSIVYSAVEFVKCKKSDGCIDVGDVDCK